MDRAMNLTYMKVNKNFFRFRVPGGIPAARNPESRKKTSENRALAEKRGRPAKEAYEWKGYCPYFFPAKKDGHKIRIL